MKLLVKFIAIIKTAKVSSIFAALPLFFSWLVVLSLHKDKEVQKNCLYSAVLSSYFFIILFVSLLFYLFFPMFGKAIAAVLHLIGIVLYFSLSIILIYSIYRSKKMEISLIEKHYKFFASIINLDTSAHSSIG